MIDLKELGLTVLTAGANKRIKRAANEERDAIAAYHSAKTTLEQEHTLLQRVLNERGAANKAAYDVLKAVLAMLQRFDQEPGAAGGHRHDETPPRIAIEQIQNTLTAIDSALHAMAGAGAGAAATAAAWAAVSAFGTASTGAAIGMLHGIAAHNAAMAWFGGGALAAGGGGMAAGAVVLGGAATVAAIAVTAFLAHRKASKVISEIRSNISRIAGLTKNLTESTIRTQAAVDRVARLSAETQFFSATALEKLAAITKAVSDLQTIASSLTDVMKEPVLNADGSLSS
jgi:hypothetical protein